MRPSAQARSAAGSLSTAMIVMETLQQQWSMLEHQSFDFSQLARAMPR